MSERHPRGTALPEPMQGQWLDDDGDGRLIVADADVSYRDRPIAFDWFTVKSDHGALGVDFGVDDPAREDSFARDNLSGLVIDPDGRFLGWNTKFGVEFRRAE